MAEHLAAVLPVFEPALPSQTGPKADSKAATVLPAPDQQAAELASLAVNAGRALQDEKRHYEIACQENARLRADIAELRRLAGEAQQDAHVCRPGAGYYYCPTSARVESDCHGGFDVCCDRPELHLPQREAQQDPAQDGEALPSSTAPLASGLPLVKGNCPACQHASLFLGTGGYPTCSNADCPEPDAATTVLEQYANEAHSPSHAWTVESPRRDNWASWGATYDDRDWASDSYESAVSTAPQRPFRLVRATTTYTVEAEHTPAAVARSGQPETD
ncbi:hypothetical protein [Streptomyces sp. SCL15-4]|uniref:hypothetical protein n=1 Tax=Streptomyces sp. SCL15-4 TaxID=2967221 RepID=UPI00296640C3|nr:hypothetical protein [Streptomyces sp. SCL15-4]